MANSFYKKKANRSDFLSPIKDIIPLLLSWREARRARLLLLFSACPDVLSAIELRFFWFGLRGLHGLSLEWSWQSSGS
jgi:hypothetical protein